MLNGIEAMNDAGGVLTVKSRAAVGRGPPDLRCVIYHQAVSQRHGLSHQ
jgi:hypothetical protein